jgi:anti-anti-sigma regulatory factor
MSSITACRTAAGFLVRVEGRGTMQESPALREFAAAIDAGAQATLAVDLSACEYLDSTFLGCIAGIWRRTHGEPLLSLAICAPPDIRRRLLGATRLDTVLHCEDAAPAPTGPWSILASPELEKHEFGLHILECHRRLSEIESPSSGAFKVVADQLEKELSAKSGS